MRYTPFAPSYPSRLNPLGGGFQGINPGGPMASPSPFAVPQASNPLLDILNAQAPAPPDSSALLAAFQQAGLLDAQGNQLLQNAAAAPLPRPVNVAPRLENGIGLLLSGLLGGAEGASAFLGQRQLKANQDTAYQGQVYDNSLRRADLQARGYATQADGVRQAAQARANAAQTQYGNELDAFQGRQNTAVKLYEGDLNRGVRTDIAAGNNATKITLAQFNANAKAELQSSKLDAQALYNLARLPDRTQRAAYLAAVPGLDISDDAREWLLTATGKEIQQDARTKAIAAGQKLTEAKTVSENTLRTPRQQKIQAEIGAIGVRNKLNEAQTSRIYQIIANYPEEFQARIAQIHAQTAAAWERAKNGGGKAADPNAADKELGIALSRESSVNKAALKRYQDMNFGIGPDSGSEDAKKYKAILDRQETVEKSLSAANARIQERVSQTQASGRVPGGVDVMQVDPRAITGQLPGVGPSNPQARTGYDRPIGPGMTGPIGGNRPQGKPTKKPRSGKTRTGSSFTYTPG